MPGRPLACGVYIVCKPSFLATKSTFGRFRVEFVDIVVCAYGDKRISSLSLFISRSTQGYLSARAIQQCLHPPASLALLVRLDSAGPAGCVTHEAGIALQQTVPSLPARWRATSPHVARSPMPAMDGRTRV